MLVLPALLWGAAYGLRLHYYDDALARRDAAADAYDEEVAELETFASEPLALLDWHYLVGDGHTKLAEELSRNRGALASKASGKWGVATRRTPLTLPEGPADSDRVATAFDEVLRRLDAAVQQIDPDVPLDVYMHVPVQADARAIVLAWDVAWRARRLRPVRGTHLVGEQGVMVLDEWLDEPGGDALERVALCVAVQLDESPADHSADGVVAILLGWEPLAARRDWRPSALLHRPVRFPEAAVEEGLARAIRWGGRGDKPAEWWATRTSTAKHAPLQKALRDGSPDNESANEPSLHDIDAALGCAGVASPWLAIALAAEKATASQSMQGALCCGPEHDAMVVAPVKPKTSETSKI